MEEYNKTIQRAAGNKMTILDPRDVMCDRSECFFFDERLLYADDDHFSEYGGYYILKHFENEIFKNP